MLKNYPLLLQHDQNVEIDGIISIRSIEYRGSTSTIIKRSEISDIRYRASFARPAIRYGRNRHALRARRAACHEEEKLLLTISWVDTFSLENRRH